MKLLTFMLLVYFAFSKQIVAYDLLNNVFIFVILIQIVVVSVYRYRNLLF